MLHHLANRPSIRSQLERPLPLVQAFELLHELALGLEQQPHELRTLGLGHLRVLRGFGGRRSQARTARLQRCGAGSRGPATDRLTDPQFHGSSPAAPLIAAHTSPFTCGAGVVRAIWCSSRMRAAARSPMITHGAMVLPVVTRGMIDASAIRRLSMP